MNPIRKFKEYLRILKITKKPDKDELISTIRIVLIGIAIIGGIGFLFYLISVLFLGGL